MCGEAYLISRTYASDSIGNQIPTETRQHILVEEHSITRQEWAEAGRQGLSPALLLVTHKVNYSGQDQIEYCNVRYGIYRTYEHDEQVEMYLERKGGVS